MDTLNTASLLKSIAPSESDSMLDKLGYDLRKEYVDIIKAANFDTNYPVLDIATGSGRMTSILSRFGFQIITGDISDDQKEKALERITPEYQHLVKFMILNSEDLPFEDDMFKNLACVNTVHHFDKPALSLYNLVRVVDPAGTLVVSDFNQTGFDIIDKVHHANYGESHSEGFMKMEKVIKLLKTSFDNVEILNTELNIAAIAKNKKSDWRKTWDSNMQ